MAANKEAYLCLSAMLHAREPRLLNDERIRRMLEAANFEEAAKQLVDCGYEDMSLMNSKEIDGQLSAHRAEIFDEAARMAPDVETVDIFRVRYDYHNAKAIIKAEAVGQDAQRLMSRSGRVSPEKLLEAYQEENYSNLPGLLGPAMREAKGVLARTENPQLSDVELDNACFKELTELADRLGNDFVKGYVRLLIDSTNLKSAVRTLKMGKDTGFLINVLADGGSVRASRIGEINNREELTELFANGKLAGAAALGVEAISGGTMTRFELACDNALNTYLKDAKLVAYGPESVLAYLAAVESEITAVRMILTARLSGIRPETIRERLRDMYA